MTIMELDFPLEYSSFIRKRDAAFDGDPNGDYVMSTDVNELQESIEKIEQLIAIDEFDTSISNTLKNKVDKKELSDFGSPLFISYNGSSINAYSTIEERISAFSYIPHVMLTKEESSNFDFLIQKVKMTGTKLYGIINCSSLQVNEVEVLIDWFKTKVFDGVYLQGFGFESGLIRSVQNHILSYAHDKNIIAIISGEIETTLFNKPHNNNPLQEELLIQDGDIYLAQNIFVTNGVKNEVSIITSKVFNLNKAQKEKSIQIFVEDTTDISLDNGSLYIYGKLLATLYNLDGYSLAPNSRYALNEKVERYLHGFEIGKWKVTDPIYVEDVNFTYRTLSKGKLKFDKTKNEVYLEGVELSNSIYTWHRKQIPGYTIDLEQAEYTNAATKIVVDAINKGEDKIHFTKIDGLSGDGSSPDSIKDIVVRAINNSPAAKAKNPPDGYDAMAGNDFIHGGVIDYLDASAIKTGNLSVNAIKTNLLEALEAYIGTAYIDNALIGELEAKHITANVVEAINLYADNAGIDRAYINSALINNLTVESMKANVVDAIKLYAGEAKIGFAQIETVKANHIKAATVEALEVSAASGTFDNLQAAVIKTINASITNAYIDGAIIGEGTVDSAQIADGSITDGKIVTLTANKITAGRINTGQVTLQGDNGKMRITGDRLQVFDDQAVPVERVSIGDVNADGTLYGLRVRGEDGVTVLYDEKGVYNEGITDGAITNPKISKGAIDGEKHIAANTITADKIVTESLTSDQIAARSIKANRIQVGALTAASGVFDKASIETATIADEAVTNSKIKNLSADKIVAGTIQLTSRNLVANSAFKKDLLDWGISADLGIGAVSTTVKFNGTNSVHLVTSGQTTLKYAGIYSKFVSTGAGEVFSGSVYMMTQDYTKYDHQPEVEIEFFNDANTRLYWQSNPSLLTVNNEWKRISVSATAPTGATKVRLHIFHPQNGETYASRPMLQKGNIVTEWTGDGSFLTDDGIYTGELQADQIKAGRVKAEFIEVGADSNFAEGYDPKDKLNLGSNYNGVTITSENGVVVENLKNKVTLNATDGLSVTNKLSTAKVFELDSNTGNLKITGDINMKGGSISWSDVTAPDYSNIGGSKPPTDSNNTENELRNNANIKGMFIDQSGKLVLNADEIKSGKVKAQYVEIGSQTSFANGYDPTAISIGGLNLLPNSAFTYGHVNNIPLKWSAWSGTGNSVVEISKEEGLPSLPGFTHAYKLISSGVNQGIQIDVPVMDGKDYVLSGYIYNVSGQSGLQLYNNTTYISDISTTVGKWKRVVVKATATSTGTMTIQVGRGNWGSNGTHYFSGLKFEQGNKESAWTPTPYDGHYDDMRRKNVRVRYVRDWMYGSTANTGNHWIDLKVMRGGTNLAKGKTPISNQDLINGTRITDEDLDINNYAQGTAGTLQYVQIDLGQVYLDVDYIQVWHYYGDARTYHNTKVEVSEDGLVWTPLFDSAVLKEYPESSAGLIVPVNVSAITSTTTTKLTVLDGSISAMSQTQEAHDGRLTSAEGYIGINGANIKSKAEKTVVDGLAKNVVTKGPNPPANPEPGVTLWYDTVNNVIKKYVGLSITSNYVGKVSTSTTENVNIAKTTNGSITATSLLAPSAFTTEFATVGYNGFAALDGSVSTTTVKATGAISQHLFSYDIIRFLENNYGVGIWKGKTTLQEKILIAEQITTKFNFKWNGWGSGPSGNKATIAMWFGDNSAWSTTKPTHSNGMVTELSYATTPSNHTQMIDANGFIHGIAFSDASDNVVNSNLYSDYAALEITTNVEWVEATGDLSVRITSAEQQITPDAITSTVTSNKIFSNHIQGVASANLIHNTEFKDLDPNTSAVTSWTLSSIDATNKWALDTSLMYDGSNTLKGYVTGQTTDKWMAVYSEFIPCVPGEDFMASLYAYVPDLSLDEGRGLAMEIEWYNASNSRISSTGKSIEPTVINTWTRFSHTATAPDNTVKVRIRFHPNRNGTMWIARPFLGRGKNDGGWLPHTDELAVNTRSQITQQADKISLVVDGSNNIKGDNLISAINLQPNTIKISAKNVDINGSVTFENSFDQTTKDLITNIQQTADLANSTGGNGIIIKPDYSSFTAAATNQMYIHGLDVSGKPADVNGYLNINGTKKTVTKGVLNPGITGEGYIMYDDTNSTWYYVRYNGVAGTWVKYNTGKTGHATNFTPADQHYFIGYVTI